MAKTASWSLVFASAFCGACLLAAANSSAATPDQVEAAIKSGTEFLYHIQGADGSWENFEFNAGGGGRQRLRGGGGGGGGGGQNFGGAGAGRMHQEGGVTAMCVFALLTAGESEKDPRLAKGIQYLLKSDIDGTYALAFEALALDKMKPSPTVQTALKKIEKLLLEGGERPGDALGLYTYFLNESDRWDHSCSQYGVLGMWACEDAGVEIPDHYWDEVDKAWRHGQDPKGSWAYSEERNEPRPSMSTAGIATLFICDDFLGFRRSIDCKGNVPDTAIEKGINWLIPYLSGPHSFYEWYGIERIGIASGYKYFGTYDWFRSGADFLVRRQNANGSWEGAGEMPVPASTSFAVLFLTRGRAPVIMSKLIYDRDPAAAKPVEGNWNQRPRDAAGAAKFIGTELERFLNWQVVTLAVDPDDLHDAPILYITGDQKLDFSEEQQAKLRRFVQEGGMLLGNADCGSKTFSDSFKGLCEKLFDDQYHFRNLEPDHAIFTHQQFLASKWTIRPAVMGLSNGARELALLIPNTDPSKAWQTRSAKINREAFELIDDIYLYSVDRQGITAKGVTYIVKPMPGIKTTSTVKLARLEYPGNWNPEPAGWQRLAAILRNKYSVNLQVDTLKLGDGKLAGYTIAHLTGSTALQLSDPARAEIKQFVNNGGTLIVDATGGSTVFADAAQKEMGLIFGDAAAHQLDSTMRLGSPIFGDMTLDDFKYRSIARVNTDTHGVLIRSITINKRPAVIFSREDLSAGLVGEEVDGIIGCTPETATKLMSNFILAIARPSAAVK